MMHARVPDEAPVTIVGYARECDVRGRREVRDVKPHRHVLQCRSLHLVERAGVSETKWIVHDVLLRRPRIDAEELTLVSLDKDGGLVQPDDSATHAVHVAHLLIQVLREHDTRTEIDRRVQRLLPGHL